MAEPGRERLIDLSLHFAEKSFRKFHPADVDREIEIVVAQEIALKMLPERRLDHKPGMETKSGVYNDNFPANANPSYDSVRLAESADGGRLGNAAFLSCRKVQTNDEARMPDDEGMAKSKAPTFRIDYVFYSVIRISSLSQH
jgi:hypothetical protein